ncbi:uncharacterized protein EI97DRAFT_271660 [Westerdykella ornata]|uniref:Xylanolytic transcriptional activator regulatory domain-containing protein n=1 Tax=Westerdykella ornata TaxID=318751 RepID=A0A6A6JPW9_WESOR|nr:uncharacterized protein EI97DRAFT_271660 [Westerdykella ornata]KAF2277726.1 hypothetical protein EI97DRAFT_271660 [Westerdykella ornata]
MLGRGGNACSPFRIFPLFHQPTLLQKVHDQEYLRNRGCFASLMAACALASARERDGALYGSIKDTSMVSIPSETFYTAAKDTLPKNLVEARDFDHMRACALLSITSIQYGDIEAMQLYLGHYFTLVGIHRFHDEAYWPKNITNIEVEERRRLYWSTYTLDVYTSIVWNRSVHAYGANARVHYPTEVEDELITPLATLPSPLPTTSWLRGWNFTTDLYLTLEHASSRVRARYARIDDRIDVAAVFGMPASKPSAAVLASITAHYDALPPDFKMFAPPTGDRGCDIFGFQAANIQATLLLLRMLFLCTDDDHRSQSDVLLKCHIAAEHLAVFQTIPTAYLCGISTPLFYHLAGIGMILGSVMEGPLSEEGYLKVKGILLSIADLLESLESGLSRAADISKGLRAQVERMEEYMRVQRRPGERSYAQPQLNQDQGMPVPQQHPAPNEDVGMHTAGVGDDEGGAQVAEAEDAGAEAEGPFDPGWLGEFQLPPELLEDWPWPFNLQPEGWSFLGTGVGAREGGW